MDRIPHSWRAGNTYFIREYRPDIRAVVILATRVHKNRTAYAEHFIVHDLLQYNRDSVKMLVDQIEAKLMKALDIFIEEEAAGENTSDRR